MHRSLVLRLAPLFLVAAAACGGGSSAPTGTTGGETNTSDPLPTDEPVEPTGETARSSGAASGEEGAAPTCANVRCASGTHCELRQVMCVRAPCPPLPECVAD